MLPLRLVGNSSDASPMIACVASAVAAHAPNSFWTHLPLDMQVFVLGFFEKFEGDGYTAYEAGAWCSRRHPERVMPAWWPALQAACIK